MHKLKVEIVLLAVQQIEMGNNQQKHNEWTGKWIKTKQNNNGTEQGKKKSAIQCEDVEMGKKAEENKIAICYCFRIRFIVEFLV